MQETEATDSVRPAPTALFTIPKFPELPRVRPIESGDSLEAILREELGGEPEEHLEVDALGQRLGVIDVLRRGETKVHVHSYPNAVHALEGVIRQIKAEMDLMSMLSEAGLPPRVMIIAGPPGVCICGQCEGVPRIDDIGGDSRESVSDDELS